MFCASDNDALLGLSRDVGSEKRPSSSCRSALVSGFKLLEDWLELGELCDEQRLRAHHLGVFEWRT